MSRDFDDRPRASASPVVEYVAGVVSTLVVIALLIATFNAFAG